MSVPWEAVIALLTYVISSTVGFVWWMATQTMRQEYMQRTLDQISKSMTTMEALYARKEDVARDFAYTNGSLKKAWEKLDKLEERK